jgi:hypothetical protein
MGKVYFYNEKDEFLCSVGSEMAKIVLVLS